MLLPESSDAPVKIRRVALAFSTIQPHLERVTRGILDFANRSGWQLAINPEGATVTLANLKGWDGDGVLAMVETEADLALAQSLPMPVVNLSARLGKMPLPTVRSDNWAIGQLAARFFLERGFRKCAFYGLSEVYYSQERLRGFRETVEAAGGEVNSLLTGSNLEGHHPWEWDREALETWLLSLQGRVGILVAHDYRAQLVLETARRLGISIPGELAVLGVNDDPVACGGSIPPLSSVPQDGYTLGQTAAAMLAECLTGRNSVHLLEVPPLKVSARKSTETLGVEEPRLRRALEYIETQLHRSFGVEEVAAHLDVSRRWLEQLFTTHLACSPHGYIVRQRTQVALRLLETVPGLRPAELARRCGFPSTRSLHSALGKNAQ